MVLKGPRNVAPVRADVYLVGSLASAAAPCSSSSGSGSGLLRANWTFVGTPLGYRYLYPCAHSMMASSIGAKFLLELTIWYYVCLLMLSLQALIFVKLTNAGG